MMLFTTQAVLRTNRSMFLEVVAGYFFLLGDIGRYANSWRFCTDHHDKWDNTVTELRCRADQVNRAGGVPHAWPYMDALMTGGQGCVPFSHGPHCPGMSDNAYRTEFALWSLTQSPLIVSTDVRVMTPIMNETLLNAELLAFHASTKTPPGRRIAIYGCSEPLHCSVWGRPLDETGSDWFVALVNTGKLNHTIKVSWGDLDWDHEQPASVRDLWRHQDLPQAARGTFGAPVPSHGTAAFRIRQQPAGGSGA